MKKLYSLLILGLFVCQYTVAQNPPVAVNDTFYFDFSDTAVVRTLTRGGITANDYDVDGNTKIIDTISYNGIHQVQAVYYQGTFSWLRVKDIKLTTSSGFFGLDSITYFLTDNGVPTGFDTAIIYVYIERKAYENLEINNVRARVHKNILFQDYENSIAGFNVPKQNNSTDLYYTSIYAANLWMAGKHQDTIYNSSATFEEQWHSSSVFEKRSNAGPIMNSFSYEHYSYEWDRVWKVSKIDIQNHISGFSTSEAIANWPAHGDTAKGQAYYLAPFEDTDNDGIYNPALGDYPKIKGQQAVYFIRNDERYQRPIRRPMRSEIHGMVYAFDCPEDSAINHTVFLDYKIYNRSNRNYDSVYVGMWVDFDLGNSNDDYLGCDVSRGTFYVYNGDMNDEDASGVAGYGPNLPAQGVTFLKGAKQTNDGNDNPLTTDIPTALTQNGIPYEGLGIGFGDNIIDNEFLGLNHFMYYNIGAVINGNGDPNSDLDYYNFLKGFWANGNQLEWGGDGNPLSTGGGTPSKYMFPGDSDPLYWSTYGVPVTPVPWTEVEAGNASGDRRGVGSTGPFTFQPNEYAEIELAFVFGRDYLDSSNIAGIVVMNERVDSIRSYHANGFATTACGGAIIGVKDHVKENNDLEIYPNPFTNKLRINYSLNTNATLEVFNLLGKKLQTQRIANNSTVLDLSAQLNGVYFVKVIDGNKVITRKVIKQ